MTYLVEQAKLYNLPLGIVINRCVATTRARGVPVILINTTKQSIWIWKPLLVTELFTMKCHQIEHGDNMERRGHIIDILFLPVAPNTIWVQLEQVEVTSSDMTPSISSDKPAFGPRSITKAMGFHFEAEVNHLPFKLNFGQDTKMTFVQQSQFIDIIYDHPEVFSLYDEDLGFYDQIKYTIPMTLDKPVYSPYHTIHQQLHGEVHKFRHLVVTRHH